MHTQSATVSVSPGMAYGLFVLAHLQEVGLPQIPDISVSCFANPASTGLFFIAGHGVLRTERAVRVTASKLDGAGLVRFGYVGDFSWPEREPHEADNLFTLVVDDASSALLDATRHIGQWLGGEDVGAPAAAAPQKQN